MEVEPADPSSQSYTILRIKRKRNEEPLDALVVDSGARRKKSRGGTNVFQFAETVEEGTWNSSQRKQELQARISSLAQEKPQPETVSSPPLSKSGSRSPTTERSVRQSPVDMHRSYKVVLNDEAAKISQSRQSTAPPKILSSKELAKPSFTMYEAIPEATRENTPALEDDPDMANFLPMLQEYLKVNDIDTSHPSKSRNADDSDYVWDVFYQRPTKFQSLYEYSNNIGTVTGLPPDTDLSDSDDESSVEDEVDEDSNDENWYANDYPDEEESEDSERDSDIFHDGSEGEEFYDDDGDHDWR